MNPATDRELLELAAKACGWEFIPSGAMGHKEHGWLDKNTGDMYWDDTWHPMANDGDALRLAVMLGIKVTPNKYAGDGAQAEAIRHPGVAGAVSWVEGNPRAQVRRAIVMVAAEIGRSMP